jgi:hypothetical protein
VRRLARRDRNRACLVWWNLANEDLALDGGDPGAPAHALLRALRERFAPASVLYPGCFLHITPSFWVQHVVYVDRNPLAARFVADVEGVRRMVDGHKRYRQPAFVRFVEQDYALGPLPLGEATFDLLLTLYAPDVSRTCAVHLRPGGVLLTNNHGGDAVAAAADRWLEFVERRGEYHLFRRRRLDQYPRSS